jgi:drug/metabolite transporter (DMT)-like permease
MHFPRPSGALNWRVIAAFAAVYIVWSSSYLGIRFALETLPPFFISGLRFLIAGTLIYGLARWKGAPAPTRIQWRSAALLGLFMFFIANGCLMWAETTLASGLAATLYATVPLWFALLGWLWLGDKRPDARTVIGLVTGFGGIILLINPGSAASSLNPLGVVLVLISAASWAFGSLLSRRVQTPDSLMLGAGMNLITSGIMLTTASLLTGEFAKIVPAAVSLRSLVAIVYLAVASSTIAFLAYTWLLAHVPANRVATYAYVNPVFAVLLGALMGGESLTPLELLASAIIIASVALITLPRPKAQPEAAAPRFRTRLKALAIWQAR